MTTANTVIKDSETDGIFLKGMGVTCRPKL